jgi:hypothetical protein
MGRWECPIPSSRLVMQIAWVVSHSSPGRKYSKYTGPPDFQPTAEEIIEFTVPHLETAPYPIVSFGQVVKVNHS